MNVAVLVLIEIDLVFLTIITTIRTNVKADEFDCYIQRAFFFSYVCGKDLLELLLVTSKTKHFSAPQKQTVSVLLSHFTIFRYGVFMM